MSTRHLRGLRLPLLLAVLGILAYARWPLNRAPAPTVWRTTPADQKALHSMQERIRLATLRVMPAVVAVRYAYAKEGASSLETRSGPEPYASGVIITADGLVLSQFHVSHRLRWKPGETYRSRQPGERTMVILSDGRRIEAELLGADETSDLSLLRLVEPGPYPHAALEPSSGVGLGDWVLKLGHPTGYRRDRPPPVRLGRVLFRNGDLFVTDCFVVGGDSGGPYFDLEGRLVGISHSGGVPAKLTDSLANWAQEPPRVGPMSSLSNRFIQQRLHGMLHREIAPFDRPAAERFWESYRRVADREVLPRDHWTQGERAAEPFRETVRIQRLGVTAILDEAGRQVALGTVVDADGWVMTTASTLPAEPRCQLSDAQVLAASVVGVSPAFDLALLKVQRTGLTPVTWAERTSPVAGTILAAVGMSGTPAAIGIVSVPRRDLPGPFPTRVSRRQARRPGVIGKPTAQGYLVDAVHVGESHDAGIRPGDVIVSLAGRDIHSDEDLLDCVRGRVEGERVAVGLLRGGQRQDLILSLVAETKPFAGFPTFFEHDMPLAPDQCGGPVVDLAGGVVGITVCRSPYGCMAIPGDCIKQLLPVLKSRGLSDEWIKPPPALAHRP